MIGPPKLPWWHVLARPYLHWRADRRMVIRGYFVAKEGFHTHVIAALSNDRGMRRIKTLSHHHLFEVRSCPAWPIACGWALGDDAGAGTWLRPEPIWSGDILQTPQK